MKKAEEKNEWFEKHYNAADINDKLIINLRDLSHTMRFLYEGKGSQKRVLIVLDENGGGATQRELTERLGIQPGSASEVIAKLENSGCVTRTLHETDRRIVDVRLTEKGKVLAAEYRAQRIQRHEEMFSCLSDMEKAQMLLLLEKVNAAWRKQYRDIDEDCLRCKHHRRHQEKHMHEGE